MKSLLSLLDTLPHANELWERYSYHTTYKITIIKVDIDCVHFRRFTSNFKEPIDYFLSRFKKSDAEE